MTGEMPGGLDEHFLRALDSMLDLVVLERAVRDERGVIVDFVIEWMNSSPGDVAGLCVGGGNPDHDGGVDAATDGAPVDGDPTLPDAHPVDAGGREPHRALGDGDCFRDV